MAAKVISYLLAERIAPQLSTTGVRFNAINSTGPLTALLGLLLLSGLVGILTTNRDIDRHGTETTAQVTEMREERRKNSSSYLLDLRYTARDGSIHTATRAVESETYMRAGTENTIAIKYLPNKPSKFIIVGEPLGSLVLLIGALAMFALSITCELLRHFLN